MGDDLRVESEVQRCSRNTLKFFTGTRDFYGICNFSKNGEFIAKLTPLDS